jgi:hypothetical protein
MSGLIFHNLINSTFKIIKTLDVDVIKHVYYYKRSFKIFDTKNDYQMLVLHDPPNWYSNSITFIQYPTEQRCKNERDEILFKKAALNKYVKKIQNDILPRNFGEIMYDQQK